MHIIFSCSRIHLSCVVCPSLPALGSVGSDPQIHSTIHRGGGNPGAAAAAAAAWRPPVPGKGARGADGRHEGAPVVLFPVVSSPTAAADLPPPDVPRTCLPELATAHRRNPQTPIASRAAASPPPQLQAVSRALALHLTRYEGYLVKSRPQAPPPPPRNPQRMEGTSLGALRSKLYTVFFVGGIV